MPDKKTSDVEPDRQVRSERLGSTHASVDEEQIFDSVGPYGENGWIEEYVVHVEGETLGGVVLVKRNEAGQTQHVIAGYRPRTSVLYLSRRLREELAGTPYAEHFASASS